VTDIHTKYPAEFKCDDGHFVRSKAEMLIDNWLYKKGIIHEYETKIFLPNNPDSDLYCDFYLPTLGVYIEYWGREGDSTYDKRKNQKIDLYRNNSLKLISLNDNDIKRLNDILPKQFATADVLDTDDGEEVTPSKRMWMGMTFED